MCITKKSGPKIDPWGTPLTTSTTFNLLHQWLISVSDKLTILTSPLRLNMLLFFYQSEIWDQSICNVGPIISINHDYKYAKREYGVKIIKKILIVIWQINDKINRDWSRKQFDTFEFFFINSKQVAKIELTSGKLVIKCLKSNKNFDFEIEFLTRNKNEFPNRNFNSIIFSTSRSKFKLEKKFIFINKNTRKVSFYFDFLIT